MVPEDTNLSVFIILSVSTSCAWNIAVSGKLTFYLRIVAANYKVSPTREMILFCVVFNKAFSA